jgi:hypothetical protein
VNVSLAGFIPCLLVSPSHSTNTIATECMARAETDDASAARRGALRHQSILSIDMPTWQAVVDAFNIKEPMIPHRREQTQGGPGAKGWYN